MTTRRPRLATELLEGRDLPATAFGLNAAGSSLFRFDTATPATLSPAIPVSGTVLGDVLVAIDYRPATGQLYAVGANVIANTVQVYTLDPNTGVATAVGAAPVAFPGTNTIVGATHFSMDFNPVADRIRVITDLASDGDNAGNVNNFRLNPTTGALVAVDPDLDFTALPGGSAPEAAIAYTNSGGGSTPAATTLLGITSGGDQLVTHTGAPGFPTLTAVGALGADTGVNAGFDIYGPDNTAVAILNVGGVSGLYTINATTGAATLVGNVGDGTTQFADLAVAPATAPSIAGGSADGKVVPLVPTPFGTDAGKLTAGTAVTAFAGSTSNVRATTGDVNGDGVADIIAVTGPGTPIRVTAISGVDNTTVLVAAFDPFGGNFTGGGFVTAVDLDADGKAEFIVTPDQGGGPRVSIFSRNADGTTATKANFFGIDDPNFRGGARAATAYLDGDAVAELVVGAGFLGGPRVAVFKGTTLLSAAPTRLIGDFFAFPGTDVTTLRNGVFVTGSDINGDGIDDLVFGGGPGGGPRVFVLDGAKIAAGNVSGAQAAPVANFFVANNATDRGGIRVSYANLDGDNKGDLIVGSGEGSAAKVRAYLGKNFTTTAEPTTFQDVTVFGGAALPGGVFVG